MSMMQGEASVIAPKVKGYTFLSGHKDVISVVMNGDIPVGVPR